MAKLVTPENTTIVGTREMVMGTAWVHEDSFSFLGKELVFDYSGETDVDWNTQRTVDNENDRVFVDENGDLWLESQCTYSDKERDEIAFNWANREDPHVRVAAQLVQGSNGALLSQFTERPDKLDEGDRIVFAWTSDVLDVVNTDYVQASEMHEVVRDAATALRNDYEMELFYVAEMIQSWIDDPNDVEAERRVKRFIKRQLEDED